MKTKVLKENGKMIPADTSSRHDPQGFFRNREGLYIWSSFESRVLSKADSTEKETVVIDSYDLIRNASDKTIENELPEKHIFTETEVCALIAGLISHQAAGEEGTLLTNGYSNIFYTPSCVVGVHRVGGGWHVRAWGRGGRGWRAGYRVFSPATEI